MEEGSSEGENAKESVGENPKTDLCRTNGFNKSKNDPVTADINRLAFVLIAYEYKQVYLV